ncbi:MAG: hypothetical protein ACRDTG_25555 [Pseudonocardiaceae bacterium]
MQAGQRAVSDYTLRAGKSDDALLATITVRSPAGRRSGERFCCARRSPGAGWRWGRARSYYLNHGRATAPGQARLIAELITQGLVELGAPDPAGQAVRLTEAGRAQYAQLQRLTLRPSEQRPW